MIVLSPHILSLALAFISVVSALDDTGSGTAALHTSSLSDVIATTSSMNLMDQIMQKIDNNMPTSVPVNTIPIQLASPGNNTLAVSPSENTNNTLNAAFPGGVTPPKLPEEPIDTDTRHDPDASGLNEVIKRSRQNGDCDENNVNSEMARRPPPHNIISQLGVGAKVAHNATKPAPSATHTNGTTIEVAESKSFKVAPVQRRHGASKDTSGHAVPRMVVRMQRGSDTPAGINRKYGSGGKA
ncbi:MAG: hypothetical protein CYPHOPRED_000761 [Cyphobasidiales sp. Tagirdzhanova-0007]|nr:MAG: hypothetical protein CYPHOPRED_000761 [Cyphobasidiales sp. Tagirdzhanova-0007]